MIEQNDRRDTLPTPPLVTHLREQSQWRRTPQPGGEISWRLWGAGRPLVLIHGGSGSWLHWVRNVEPLAQHFQLLVPDLPGLGQSDLATVPFDPQTWSGWLLDGLDALIGPEAEFAIVGFSFGSLFATHVARLAGKRARALALIGPAGLGRYDRAPTWTMRSWRNLPDFEARLAAHRHNLAALMLSNETAVDDLALYVQATVTAQSRFDTRPVALSDTVVRTLPEVSAPLTVIYGANDVTADGRIGERRAQILDIRPDCDWRVVPGVGHWAAYEAPRAVEAILTGLAGSAFGTGR